MTTQRRPRNVRPLDEASLDELGLRYVSRFATTRAKLTRYLQRKLRERGWAGDGDADIPSLVGRLSGLGYVDDRGFALAKAVSHQARGLGRGRLRIALRAAGVGDEEGTDALDAADRATWDSALRFARRRRFGPFAPAPLLDPKARQRALGAFVRAGHGFDVANAILALPPDPSLDLETIRYQLSHTHE